MKQLLLLGVILVIGFVVWLNYGWILWNLPLWQRRAGKIAIATWGDAWEKKSQQLGGPHAINCGRIRIRENPEAATECALRAFRDGTPFRVRYDLRGIDSDVSAGLVYGSDRQLYALTFDGDPSGRGGTSWSRQRATKLLCPLPFRLYVNPNGRANCFTDRAVPPQNIMSPTLESY